MALVKFKFPFTRPFITKIYIKKILIYHILQQPEFFLTQLTVQVYDLKIVKQNP